MLPTSAPNLAWIRTEIALVGFGFVMEKFDRFRRYTAAAVPEAHAPHVGRFAEGAGLVMMTADLAIVVFAARNFLKNLQLIDAPDRHKYQVRLANLILGALVAILGTVLLLYVGLALLPSL